MLTAATLVHKAAMPIGVHAVRSFGRLFAGAFRLDIHTDGSPGAEDEEQLRRAAEGMEARIVRPEDRQHALRHRLAAYPRIRALLDGIGYHAKLELPMAASEPYFYFDSDVVWLRRVSNLLPTRAPNAFSTESWSWYNGIARDRHWIAAKTPRRVNSGFYYLGEPFPFARMEEMLELGMFDPGAPYNTDQEIMAYLFREMELYHPDDLKRSRRNVVYDLATESCAALHFPGGMWREHLGQIRGCGMEQPSGEFMVRFTAPVPLGRAEIFRMRLAVALSDCPVIRGPINLLRKLRAFWQR
jgi:hypothetical protein